MHKFTTEKRIDKKFIRKKIMEKLKENKIYNSMSDANKTITEESILYTYYLIFENFYERLNQMFKKGFHQEILISKQLLDEIKKLKQQPH